MVFTDSFWEDFLKGKFRDARYLVRLKSLIVKLVFFLRYSSHYEISNFLNYLYPVAGIITFIRYSGQYLPLNISNECCGCFFLCCQLIDLTSI